ncbi:MAG: helix-turn-helix domain-containing protein [Candidatus Bathyarchaeota archaeon]|nr:helix-turn-helix domain-containing protein [Candidatus Bathyarchaeota archaeon]
MIEALLDIRIPELWVTLISEKYDVEISCQVGGQSGKGGWGLATVEGDDKNLDDIIEEVRKHPSVGDVKVKTRKNGTVSFLVDVVKCKACDVLIKAKAFMVYPVSIHKGRMKWLLITDNNKTMGKICEGLEEYDCDVKIERVTALGGKGILTERQEEVIREALSSGYFDYPKRIDSLKLAKKLGISISTLSEVLRAAQRRIFAEYLRI